MARTDPQPHRLGVSNTEKTATYRFTHPLRTGEDLTPLIKRHGDPELATVRGMSKQVYTTWLVKTSVRKDDLRKKMDEGEAPVQHWLDAHTRRQQRIANKLTVKKPIERAPKPMESEEQREARLASVPADAPYRDNKLAKKLHDWRVKTSDEWREAHLQAFSDFQAMQRQDTITGSRDRRHASDKRAEHRKKLKAGI